MASFYGGYLLILFIGIMMKREQQETCLKVKRLEDYQAYPWALDQVSLNFMLDEQHTRVSAKLSFTCKGDISDLVLNGEGLELISVTLDGQTLTEKDYKLNNVSLTLPCALLGEKRKLLLETEVEISPANNKSLEGLYQSQSMLCTQCESEGFRRITFYPDRPDVMSCFQVRLQANRSKFPVLLSNGNLIEHGDIGEDHYSIWNDPFKKPCYLFALVAGDLQTLEDSFTTMSGKQISLKIHAEKHNIDKCQHAMLALKKAMKWDEQKYGREYDLELYQIVAVDDFNSGAMENKSLNIFNSECILASKETTVDSDYELIEAIVAHEYFHNWSGNRVTLRDWFQLSLKEGFTVFRDSQFTADNRSYAIKRIEDAMLILSAQFAEDASPISHPVRPSSYTEIRNFYTLTVYEKGAEVIAMLATLLGWKDFRKGTDLYFQRHDGQAVCVEDFVAAMEDASSRSLSQFMLWYSQSGTPEIHVTDSYDKKTQNYKITMHQSLAATADQPDKKPMLIPIRFACLNTQGTFQALNKQGDSELTLELDEKEKTFEFRLPEKPTPSLLRNFSSPVRCFYDYSNEQLAHLLDYDDDAFCRWNAGHELKTRLANKLVGIVASGSSLDALDADIVSDMEVLKNIYARLIKSQLSNAQDYQLASMNSKLLALPTRSWLDAKQKIIHVGAIDTAVRYMTRYFSENLSEQWFALYKACTIDAPYRPDFEQSSLRKLKSLALSFVVQATEQGIDTTWQQFLKSDNMTDTSTALHLLVNHSPNVYGKKALESIYNKWRDEPLVVNQWLEVQAGVISEDTLDVVDALLEHPAFDIENPNKVRSLIGAFAGRSYTGFHRYDGSGYAWFTKRLLEIDGFNSQVAARLATPLSRWRRYEPCLSQAMKRQVEILHNNEISRDLREVVEKSLSQPEGQ